MSFSLQFLFLRSSQLLNNLRVLFTCGKARRSIAAGQQMINCQLEGKEEVRLTFISLENLVILDHQGTILLPMSPQVYVPQPSCLYLHMVRCRQKKRKEGELAFQHVQKTRKVSWLIPGYSVAGRNFIHPRIPAVATRRDGGGNGDHDGDDDEAVVEDATIGFGFFVVVPVFRFCLPLPGSSGIQLQRIIILVSSITV